MVVADSTPVGGDPEEASMKSQGKRALTTKRAKIRDLTPTDTGHVKGGSLDGRIILFLVPPKELGPK